MSPMNELRAQHTQILGVVDRISESLSTANDLASAERISEYVKQLEELLQEHLVIEDDFLYPVLRKRSKGTIRAVAERFSTELGGLTTAFGAYVSAFDSAQGIVESHDDFVSQSITLADALRRRIVLEDEQLFPLIEGGVATEHGALFG